MSNKQNDEFYEAQAELEANELDELVDWILKAPSYTRHELKQKLLDWARKQLRATNHTRS